MFSVAVPEAERPTVTVPVVALLNVPIIEMDSTPFSFTVDDEEVSVNVGADSFSDIVMVSCWVPFSVAPPPDTPDISRIAVSLPS